MEITTTPSLESPPTETPPVDKAEIQFTNTIIRGAVIENRYIANSIRFQPRGIFSIDKDLVFIFGGLLDYRSILLRSEDGGMTWQEVDIFDQDCSYKCTISHVLFIDNGEGWAIMEETGEEGRYMFLWHTHDYGKTWYEIYKWLKGEIASIQGMEFIDSQHGKLIYAWEMASVNDSLGVYVTSDGGSSWKQQYKQNIDIYADLQTFKAFFPIDKGGFYGNHWQEYVDDPQSSLSDTHLATGFDGSMWEMDSIYLDDLLLINKWLINETEGVTFELPMDFRYSDGLVTTP
jgi:hypothetical protein